MRTIEELAKEALDVQDACNLSGVVHSFSRALTELREILSKEESFSTTTLNEHPIAVLYADKIASLSRGVYGKAYDWALDLCVSVKDQAHVE